MSLDSSRKSPETAITDSDAADVQPTEQWSQENPENPETVTYEYWTTLKPANEEAIQRSIEGQVWYCLEKRQVKKDNTDEPLLIGG